MFQRLIKKTLFSVFFIVWPLCLSANGETSSSCPNLADIPAEQRHHDKVKWAPDGDTLHTQKGHKLRLLHINTPELNPTSSKPADPLAQKAQHALKALLKGGEVYWISDAREKDKYGRELALIFNQQGTFVNAELVRQGLAHLLLIPPNEKYWQCIFTAQKTAIQEQKGIWGLSVYQPKSPKQLFPNQGFQLVKGTISEIKATKNNRWLILDDTLWVGIPNESLNAFATHQRILTLGETITLRGFVYRSHGKLRLKLKHPAMLISKQ